MYKYKRVLNIIKNLFLQQRSYIIFTVIISTILFAWCNTEQNNASGTGQIGRLTARIVDTPADVANMYISFSQISIRKCSASNETPWVDLQTVSSKFDLTTLVNNAFKTLSSATYVPTGKYCEIRLIPNGDSEVVLTDGQTQILKVPSKIKFKGEFLVKVDMISVLTLDYDIDNSIHKAENSGKYILNPYIRIVDVQYEPIGTELVYADALKARLESIGDDFIQVQISLKYWMDIPTLRTLLTAPGAPMPTEIFVELTSAAGGFDTTVPLNNPGIDSDELTNFFSATLIDLQRTGLPIATGLQDFIETGIENELYSYALKASGPASAILSWWNNHPDDVRIIQSLVTDLDNAQGAFIPEENIQ